MVTISIDELVEALEEKRDQAINWREDCEGFGDVRGMYAANQSVLDFNTAILLAKGLMRYEVK